jgi:hypothetical protein
VDPGSVRLAVPVVESVDAGPQADAAQRDLARAREEGDVVRVAAANASSVSPPSRARNACATRVAGGRATTLPGRTGYAASSSSRAPWVVRSFEAGPEGLDVICIGGRKPEGGVTERFKDPWD